MNKRISDKFTFPSKYVEVLGSKIHYIDVGTGDPIVFLHGIPTSSYLWRNIIPYIAPLGRCIAPDLIGFGKSDKPNIEYSIVDHIHYLDKFIEALHLKNITFVLHGWGSVIGFDYAMRHENDCKGLIFYEAFLRSLADNEISLPLQEQLLAIQDEESIERIIKNGISFVDTVIPQNVMRQLSDEEMNHYREPFRQTGSGKPLLQYLKELSSIDEQSKVNQLIVNYSNKLEKSLVPKLMLYSIPGFFTTIATIIWAKEHLPNLEIVEIGEELHLAQETHPALIGETISVWLQGRADHGSRR